MEVLEVLCRAAIEQKIPSIRQTAEQSVLSGTFYGQSPELSCWKGIGCFRTERFLHGNEDRKGFLVICPSLQRIDV